MARTMKVVLVDDLDGGQADETVVFSLDGATYEIDLSRSNAARLRKAIEPYAAKARRTSGRRSKRPAAATRAPRRRASVSGRDIPAIRAWAKDRGLLSTERGRIPAPVLAAYDEAHGS